MRLVSIACAAPGGRPGVEARIAFASGAEARVHFAYDAGAEPLVTDAEHAADAFLAALLLPAMAAREELVFEHPVSPRLLGEVGRLQTIFHAWFPHFASVEVRAPAREAAGDVPASGVGAFFSGGVDSFYTLRRRAPGEPPITHLVFFHGLETTLEARRGADASEARARRVAEECGLACVVGETNLRSVFPLRWGEYCGAGLAAAALTLSGGLGRVLVPSTDGYADAHPWGSHPLVDPLWSSERTAIVADGADATRSGKLERLIDDPVARRHLRVCVLNAGGDWNCGRCTKCVRTAVALRALGVEASFETIPRELPVPLEPVLAEDHEMYLVQNLVLLERTGRAPELAARLRRVLRRRRRRAALRGWLESSPAAPLVPWLRRLRALGRG